MRKNKSKQTFLFVGSILLIIIFSIMLANSPVKGAINAPDKYYITIIINENDTLWDLAIEYANTDYYNINEYIDELIMINAIKDNRIYSGNKIMLPIIE